MATKPTADKTLDQVLADIEKQFGKGSVMKLGDNEHQKIDVVSSGSLGLDIALGIGGYPKGRIIEIYGPESSGKTTFALHAIAEVQKQGGRAAFIDAEHSLDPTYAQKLGVNYNGCSVTDSMKYRWASCTPKGNVNFSWRIIKAPVFVIEYLIVHELAHLRISEHSPEFWNIVSIQVPSYEDAKIWLRDNGNVLEVDF